MNIHLKHIIRNKKLINLEKQTRNHGGAGAYFDEEKNRYIRTFDATHKNSFKSSIKKSSTKTIRGYNKRICYKVIYDEYEFQGDVQNN